MILQEVPLKECIIQLSSGIKLVGHYYRQLKEGPFYYTFPDDRQEYAGVYEKDLKEGLWKDYDGEKLVKCFYEEGRISNIIITTLQEEGKNGYWFEVGGYNNQLKFQGCYQNNFKIGTWSITYKDEKIGGGDYNLKGFKIGEWIEVSEHYEEYNLGIFFSYCLVTYKGLYNNGKRIGYWASYSNRARLGGGNYDENGMKQGKWIELHENLYYQFPAIYSGFYKNGMWRGKLDILCSDLLNTKIESIVDGYYDECGVQKEHLIDLYNEYSDQCQAIHSDKYKSSIKMGERKFSAELSNDDKFLQQIYFIWRGQQGLKQEQRTDLSENYSWKRNIIYVGEYKNGIRVGEWDIKEQKTDSLKFEFLGGGYYDEHGVKQGFWLDIDQKYEKYRFFIDLSNFHLTQAGKYINGIRTGKWDIFFKDPLNESRSIGGGIYDEYGAKQGSWEEPDEKYENRFQVIHSGEYVNGSRWGKWDIKCKDKQSLRSIGGGNYDKNGVKQGEWIELHEKFRWCQVILSGTYKDGIRINDWKATYCGLLVCIGTFNENNQKVGYWIEILDDSQYTCQSLSKFKFINSKISGLYENNLRVGLWIASYQGKKIGGGNYNKNGQKQGFWIDPIQKYNGREKITYSGYYEQDIRIGKWIVQFDGFEVGGGNYNENGHKQGIWVDVDDKYNYMRQITYRGEYNDAGNKIGYWETLYKRRKMQNKLICSGGGIYDQNGKKNGLWIELSDYFSNFYKKFQTGEYKEGQRFGQWAEQQN